VLALNFSKPFSDHSRNPKILEHIFENSNFKEKKFNSPGENCFFFILGVSNHFSLLVFTVDILFVLGKTSSQKINSFFWILPKWGGAFPN